MKYLLVALCSFSGYAQDISEQMSVLFRDIRIHVVDEDGKPVTGLKRDDFIVKEGKHLQNVVYFEEVDQWEDLQIATPRGAYEWVRETPQVQTEGKAILVYLDTSNLHSRAFKTMKQAFRLLVEKEARPGVLMKIIHYDKEIKHLTDSGEKDVRFVPFVIERI